MENQTWSIAYTGGSGETVVDVVLSVTIGLRTLYPYGYYNGAVRPAQTLGLDHAIF
jgi:hypothetical protein